MKSHSLEFYRAAIKNCHETACDIRRPVVDGKVGEVFLANIAPDETFVYKFNDADIIGRNHKLCEKLALVDAPVPRTTVHAYTNSYFEVYPYCADKTLCEHMRAGMPKKYIFDIYCDVIRAQNTISGLSMDDVKLNYPQFFYQIMNANVCRASSSTLVRAYTAILGAMSRNGPQFLLHNDIHMKNILVTADYKLSKLIDMDAIAFCNEDFSVMQMLRAYPLDNLDELLDFYEDTTHRNLHRSRIKIAMAALSAVTSREKQIQRMLAEDTQRKR